MEEFMLKVSGALKVLATLEPLEAYTQSALTCFYSTYREEIYREVLSNPLLKEAIEACSRFVNAANKLSGTSQSLSGQTILYSIEKIGRFTKASRRKPFLVLCDCLSLPEYAYIFIWCACKNTPSDILFAVNPGGKTRTFEYLAKNYLDLFSLEKVSLEKIADGLSRKLNCSGHMFFREIDYLVHEFEKVGFISVRDMVKIFYEKTSSLIKSLNTLLTDHMLLLITDHGYDVMSKNGRVYPYHKWTGEPSLSVIAPVLVLW